MSDDVIVAEQPQVDVVEKNKAPDLKPDLDFSIVLQQASVALGEMTSIRDELVERQAKTAQLRELKTDIPQLSDNEITKKCNDIGITFENNLSGEALQNVAKERVQNQVSNWSSQKESTLFSMTQWNNRYNEAFKTISAMETKKNTTLDFLARAIKGQ